MRPAVAAFLLRDPWWAEFWSAVTAMLWAGLSYASVECLREWPSMQVLIEIGGDRFWHILAFGVGALQLAGLTVPSNRLRWAASLAQGWFWGLLTIGVWAATPWAPAVAVYAGWCGINIVSALRPLRPSQLSAGCGR